MSPNTFEALGIIRSSLLAMAAAMDVIMLDAEKDPTLAGKKESNPAPPPAKDKPAPPPPPPAAKVTNVARVDLGKRMRELALKHGKPAQEAFKNIMVNITGTQAFTQAADETLPAVAKAVEDWAAQANG